MKKDKNIIILFVLGVAGVLFSGYLSGVKFFTSTCAFGESCPYFWGYPACYFGFIMFLVIAIFSSLLLFSRMQKKNGLSVLSLVSLLGILFAGKFTLAEIPVLFQEGLGAYILGLPTCALGLIFYILIFTIATHALLKKEPTN